MEHIQSELNKERSKDIQGRANVTKLGGKNHAACPVDLLALGTIRAYIVACKGTMHRQEQEKSSPECPREGLQLVLLNKGLAEGEYSDFPFPEITLPT